jgi:hypothetical protein
MDRVVCMLLLKLVLVVAVVNMIIDISILVDPKAYDTRMNTGTPFNQLGK